MQMNYKRKQGSYKHKIQDGGYSRKEMWSERMLWSECLCPPQNPQVEILFPKEMVLGVGGAFGRS